VIGDKVIEGEFVKPLPDGRKRFVTTRVEPELAAQLDQQGVEYRRVVENTLLRDIMSWVLPAVIFFAIWMFLIRRFADRQGLGGSFLSIGKSKAKVYVETDTKVTVCRRGRCATRPKTSSKK
jgi:cell division protease FtsH